MSDGELVLAIKNGDEAAMAKVMQRYSGLLWKIASAVLTRAASEQDVEECVADAFIFLWQNPEKFDAGRGTLKSFLAVTARSRAIDRYRAVARRRETDLDESLAERTDFFGRAEGVRERKRIRDCIERLEAPDRELILRRYYFEQKPKEISSALGMDRKQVENRLYQAKRRLRRLLTEESTSLI